MQVLHHKQQQQNNQQRNEFDVQHTDKIESLYLRSYFLLISVWDLLLFFFLNVRVSCFITGFVTRLTRRVPLVVQELLTLPEHLSSPPVFSGVRVTRSLVLCVCFVDRCLSFFFWPLCSLFFDIRNDLIIPLVYSNSS